MCGIIGVFRPEGDVLSDAINGLFQQQHRGQDACGIAISSGSEVHLHKGLGHVREVFKERPRRAFTGSIAIGHVRYPSGGANGLESAQPHAITSFAGPRLAISSNGDVINYVELRQELEAKGVLFRGTSDAEVILKFIAWEHLHEGKPVLDAIRLMQKRVRGAYSAVLLLKDRMFAIRDPYALRPMTVGRADDLIVVASETTALDILIARKSFDPEPGEIVEISKEGLVRHQAEDVVSLRHNQRPTPAHCLFEMIYFSRPDAQAFSHSVYQFRKRIGAWLAEQEDHEIDLVVPIPDSSNAVALGYAQASGKPFELGLIRNHYVGRTFINSTQQGREDSVKHKFNPERSVLAGRRVILVDDSIVRGTTLRKITRMVRAAGAKEIHLRIGSPVTKYPCYYGVDTPRREELIGNSRTEEQIRQHLTADSLRYVSVEGMREILGDEVDDYCMACFDGDYCEPITDSRLKKSEIFPV